MTQPLYVAFIWHMHQPYYRDLATGACPMPWVRLHAAKDYVDMVTRLEPFPAIHQTFNLVPSLLDQLEDYLPPRNGSDEFLDVSRKDAAQLSDAEQRFLLQWFFLANLERMVKPHPRYHDLLAKRGPHVSEEEWPKILKRFRAQEFRDLQVWFNLVWIDPWLRRQDPELVRLEEKGTQFTEAEKQYVLERHLALIARVVPAYRDAAARGQVELMTSPYYHPIVPLLCELRSARAALPELPLPASMFRHPEDARWQLEQGLRRHEAAFGSRPAGVWPPEGSVSESLVALALECGVRWIATDEAILWRTLRRSRSAATLYRPHVLRRDGKQLAVVFRDRELSDLIGFAYSHWEPGRAVTDVLKRLAEIHRQTQHTVTPALVSIILDGENAWENYPDDGHQFLTRLYEALAADARFRCVTVSEFLGAYPLDEAESLPELFSGSWIDANFATWIGHPEKNAAWEHLSRARQALDEFSREDPSYAKAWQSFGAAEGSDWMWWFGDTHFTAQAEMFDRLFRLHVANSYRLAGLPAPEALSIPIRRPVSPLLFEPTGLISPTIDGRESSYYEWLYAGRVDLSAQYAAIHRGAQCLRRLWYGFDTTHCYLRLDLESAQLALQPDWKLQVSFSKDVKAEVAPAAKRAAGPGNRPQGIPVHAVLWPGHDALPCAMAQILELAVPLDVLGLNAGEPLELALTLFQSGEPIERHPAQGGFALHASSTDLEMRTWSV